MPAQIEIVIAKYFSISNVHHPRSAIASRNRSFGRVTYMWHILSLQLPGTNRTLHIIDTPGLFDTDRDMEEVKIEMAKTLLTFPHGVHAFIYVLSSTSRFTEEEHKTLKEIKVSVVLFYVVNS